MIPGDDETFPRGRKPLVSSSKKRPIDDNLFQTSTVLKLKKRRKRNERKQALSEDLFQSSLKITGTLTYNKMQDGMVILGCIRHIKNVSLEVEFPGLTFGMITISDISEPFTNYLTQKVQESNETDFILKKLFKVGQFLPAKILKVSKEKGKNVEASISPNDINADKRHDSFKKGTLVWACIKSVLEHGYEIYVGVKNCRAFLPSKNVDNGITYQIGEPLWCVVHKCEITNTASTLRLSAKKEHISAVKVENTISLHDVIPGMQVDLIVEKVTENGLQGKFLNDFFGYVDESQLQFPLDSLDRYQEGQLLPVYVLYIEPATKITHLTLRGLHEVPNPLLHVGDTLPAEVLSKSHNGVYFILSNKEKGFVTNKRLINALPKDTANLSDTIANKYSVGSKHLCRILDYNHISQLYVCTSEQHLIKQKLFTKHNAKVGQLVQVTVTEVKKNGLVVNAGHIKGFVPNLHISNANYSNSIKKKFTVGYKAKARILAIDEDQNVLLTLKQSLVESNECLTCIEQANPGDHYPGIVIQIRPAGVVVVFYGNVKGFISIKQLQSSKDSEIIDLQEYFYRGQVVNVWVSDRKGDKLLLTLQPCKNKMYNRAVQTGDIFKAEVISIQKNKLQVKSADGTIKGVLPLNHLSCNLKLCNTFLKMYKTGDIIDDLMCIASETDPIILSRREGIHHKKSNISIKQFELLRNGYWLRCTVLSQSNKGIFVTALIKDFSEKIFIKNDDIVPNDHSVPKFHKHQSIVAKIKQIDLETKQLRLTTKMNEVYDKNIDTTLYLFEQYMLDLEYVRIFGKANNWKICEYEVGQRIQCTVLKLGNEGGCLVDLPNGTSGLVTRHLCPDNVKPGQIIEGVVISQDFNGNFLEICLKKNISEKINNYHIKEIEIETTLSLIAERLLVKDNYVIAVVRNQICKGQLVCLPLYLHENSYTPCLSYYEMKKFKIFLTGKIGSNLIGISKKLYMNMKKDYEQHHKNKILHDGKLRRNEKSAIVETHVPRKDKCMPSENNECESDIEESDNEDVAEENLDEKEDSNTVETHKTAELIEITESEDSLMDEKSSIQNRTHNKYDYDSVESSYEEECLNKTEGLKIHSEEESSEDDEIDSSDEFSWNDKVEGKVKSDLSKRNDAQRITNSYCTTPTPVLPGISTFHISKKRTAIETDTSSDDEDNNTIVKKKTKLTPTERAELARQEEERIQGIEKELADSTASLQSAEQFDRFLLANPNASEIWTRYISFHISATELDKARSVARRALETIDMTMTQEKLNIWIALLHLENMYGTKDSFENVFQEAVRCNDSLEVYLKTIEMLAEAGKLSEMEEKIKKVKNRFRQNVKMWLEVAKIYYLIKKYKDARNMYSAALKSIQDQKTQFNIMVRFAIMEYKFGEEDQGDSIFETILSSDPQKVVVWITYVDQLIKKNRIDEARRLLERSISQKLPIKKMKTLFLKYRKFEEQHGNESTLNQVIQKAQEYITKVDK